MPEATGLQVRLPRRKAADKSKREDGKLGEIVDNGWQKESASEESHAVSNMTKRSKAKVKVKANVIDQVLLRRALDHPAKTVKMETVQPKGKSRKAPARLQNRISLRVSAT